MVGPAGTSPQSVLMQRVVIIRTYRERLEKAGFRTFDHLVKAFSKASPGFDGVLVHRQTLPAKGAPPLSFYFKEYVYSPASWKFIGRKSKARCEYENYEVFQNYNLPCARRIGWGEERDALGRLKRGFLMTEEIENAITLVDYVRTAEGSVIGSKARRRILEQIAGGTRELHRHHFFHHDLVWRNFLISMANPEQPLVWWIDCPRGGKVRFPWEKRSRLLKDLASLDKSAWKFCSVRERLRFFKEYFGPKPLGPVGRDLMAAVGSYRKRRWPEDWGEK